MKSIFLTTMFLLCATVSFSQQEVYDEQLANSLGADDNGMKEYVFCLLKTGSNTTATKDESAKALQGHMDNIGRLAKEGQLAVAGPFRKNDRNYRGIYIFNVGTIEEAQLLVASDPAVKSQLLEAELTLWYGTAALMETLKVHEKIVKNKK